MDSATSNSMKILKIVKSNMYGGNAWMIN
jgi:hypothetical protein